MIISTNTKYKASRLITICLISIFINASLVHSAFQSQQHIKLLGQVYAHLPQIPDQQYSIVPSIVINSLPNLNIGQKSNPVSQSDRFIAKRSGDYFVAQSSDPTHQSNRYNFIKGKNIFTPSYINSQVLQSTEEHGSYSQELAVLSQTLKAEFSKNFQQLKENQSQTQLDVPSNAKPSQQKKEEREEDRSSQIYNALKNIQALKEKNLRENFISQQEQEKTRNLQKLIAYIVIGLILSFFILKRATKPPSILPKVDQQRTQLRLRGTPDDQDDQQITSSQSDQ